jgi:predicted LPLAT superfamily acyltransferase
MGRTIGRALLYPICGYFLIFSPSARRASRHYLQRVLGRTASIFDLFRHYHCFASTLLDRVYLLSGQYRQLNITLHGTEILLDRIKQGKGCILLGAHLGSFEILRVLGKHEQNLPINILMHEDNAQMINHVLRILNPGIAQTVINTKGPDSLLRAKECIDNGELVGLLGDRVVANDKVVQCHFLGQDAAFPAGPILLASIVKAPVILMFGLYRGKGCYDIHMELLAEQVDIDRRGRLQGAQEWTQRYATRLEHYCRLAPFNWFNFYDYWNEYSTPKP